MTTEDLVRAMIAHKRWLRWAYERGIYHEFDLRDRFGNRLPDPTAAARQRVRLAAGCTAAAREASER